MSNYTTNTEFIAHELHTLVSDPALYDWEEIWSYLRDYDGIVYDPASQTFHWNDASDYMQVSGVLYDLIDAYALDSPVTEKRYVGGELWTRHTVVNAATGCTRRVSYVTGKFIAVAIYDADGTRYATVGSTHDGKSLRDADAAWDKAERAWTLLDPDHLDRNGLI